MPALVRAASLSGYETVARELGLDPRRLLRQAGLDPKALADPNRRIRAAAVVAVLEASAVQARCPAFGLRMAAMRRFADLGPISLLLSQQPTLRAVLQTMMHYRHLLNESLVLHVEEIDGLAIIREELAIEGAAEVRQSTELAVGTLFRMCGGLMGRLWQPYSVNFIHGPPADRSLHRRLFGPTVRFHQDFNGIACAAADLDCANPAADTAMAHYARQFVETLPGAAPASVTREVRKAIYLLLPMGRASLEQIAESLGMNLRTLQRRLAVENAEFSDLVTEVRRDLAARYLANRRLSMTDIAATLGYGRLSSFTRWFTDQFGASPTAWRRRLGP
jgi:AraC-like DNA-binding protein